MKKILTLILISGFVNASAQSPSNEPCGAQTLPSSSSCTFTSFSMSGATFNPTIPYGAECFQSGSVNPDIWFSYVISLTGSVTIQTDFQPLSLNSDAVMEVYSGSCGSLTYITCNDDPDDQFMPLIYLTGRTPGEQIFIRICQYNSMTNGLYKICCNSTELLDLTHNVGIGTSVPDSTLDVNGNVRVRGGQSIAGKLLMNGPLKITSGAPAAGKVLTSDATGNASWQVIPPQFPSGTVNQTLRNNGTAYVNSSALQNDGTNVTLTGQIKIQGGLPGAGKLLSSDASGLASWSEPAFSSGFSVYNIATQTLNSLAAYQKVGFPYGSGTLYNFSDSTFTVTVSGLYLISIQLPIAAYTSATGLVQFGLIDVSGFVRHGFFVPASTRSQTASTTFFM